MTLRVGVNVTQEEAPMLIGKKGGATMNVAPPLLFLSLAWLLLAPRWPSHERVFAGRLSAAFPLSPLSTPGGATGRVGSAAIG